MTSIPYQWRISLGTNFLHYYSCSRDQKRLLYPQVSTAEQWASNPTLNCKERGSIQRKGGGLDSLRWWGQLPSGCHGVSMGRYRLTRMGSFFSPYTPPPYLWKNRHGKMLYLQSLLQRASAVTKCTTLASVRACWLLGRLCVSEGGQ